MKSDLLFLSKGRCSNNNLFWWKEVTLPEILLGCVNESFDVL